MASAKAYFLAQQWETEANKMRFFDLPFQLLLSLKKKKKISHIRLCSTPWWLAKMDTEKERIIQHFCRSHPLRPKSAESRQSRVAGQSGQHACPVLTKNTRVPLAHSFQRYRSNQVQPERAQQNKEARSTRCSASGHVSINF